MSGDIDYDTMPTTDDNNIDQVAQEVADKLDEQPPLPPLNHRDVVDTREVVARSRSIRGATTIRAASDMVEVRFMIDRNEAAAILATRLGTTAAERVTLSDVHDVLAGHYAAAGREAIDYGLDGWRARLDQLTAWPPAGPYDDEATP